MPRFIIKVSPDRDAYVEWSTVVDAPVSVGNRAAYAAEHGEDRLRRTDEAGTSARFFDWLPPEEQEGGWADPVLVCTSRGGFPAALPRVRLGDVFDLIMADPGAHIPDHWLTQWKDAEPQ